MCRDKPVPDGRDLLITIPVNPVRFKASRTRKDRLTRLVREHTSQCGFLLTGEVKVDVQWLIHEQDRHESPRSPDLDNILKPLLDALQGPDGVMVNDSQIQEISCRWIDWESREQRLDLRVQHLEDEWVRKNGLVFVQVTPTLCMPLNCASSADALITVLDVWEQQFAARTKPLARSDYYFARSVMSLQRPFHICRLREFRTIPLERFRQELRQTRPGAV